LVDGFRSGLQELGYADGVNIRIEYRWAQGSFDRLPDLAADLVRLNVDVIVASVTAASLAAHKATAKIPIVMVAVGDPIGVGLITSLARPGGNITGTSSMAEITGKQFQLLREVVGNVSRIAVLWNPANYNFQIELVRQAEAAARTTGVELQLLEARASNELEPAFAAIDREGTRALLILSDPVWVIYNQTLANLAAERRLVAIEGTRIFADARGLMAYGPSVFDLYRRAASYVDKILKGATPADLPVEQPTRFEFIVNLKTAKAFGLDLPASILLRADEVIE
jgi:putative ABC transport system substrate-binding protein